MNHPYEVCSACTDFATDKHHAPEKSLLHTWDRDNEAYHRHLCRRHHNERTAWGYKRFKEKYPEYEEVTIEQYRREQRRV